MADLFRAVCGVCLVSRWVAGAPHLGKAGALRREAYGVKRKR